MTDHSKQIAETILAQLGGHRMAVMIGMKASLIRPSGVTIAFTARNIHSANRINIDLEADDTYTVTIARCATRAGKLRTTPISAHTDVYADSLRATIEQATGLYLSL